MEQKVDSTLLIVESQKTPGGFPIPAGELVKINYLLEQPPFHPKCKITPFARVGMYLAIAAGKNDWEQMRKAKKALQLAFCRCEEHTKGRARN
jgi:hypothetical protein